MPARRGKPLGRLSDISPAKTGLKNFYESTGHRYVSTHPIFGPTFAHLNALSQKKSIIPFVSTFVFAAVMKHQDAPGTTFKRHMKIAKGVLSEDNYLLQAILFNPYTHNQVAQIRTELKDLLDIIDHKDGERMKAYLTRIRKNVND